MGGEIDDYLNARQALNLASRRSNSVRGGPRTSSEFRHDSWSVVTSFAKCCICTDPALGESPLPGVKESWRRHPSKDVIGRRWYTTITWLSCLETDGFHFP